MHIENIVRNQSNDPPIMLPKWQWPHSPDHEERPRAGFDASGGTGAFREVRCFQGASQAGGRHRVRPVVRTTEANPMAGAAHIMTRRSLM
jgi:hypothetical protein